MFRMSGAFVASSSITGQSYFVCLKISLKLRTLTSIFDIADLMRSQKQVSRLFHSEAIVLEDLHRLALPIELDQGYLLLFIGHSRGDREDSFLATLEHEVRSAVYLPRSSSCKCAPSEAITARFWYPLYLAIFVHHCPVVLDTRVDRASKLDQVLVVRNEVDTVHVSPAPHTNQVLPTRARQ